MNYITVVRKFSCNGNLGIDKSDIICLLKPCTIADTKHKVQHYNTEGREAFRLVSSAEK